ncbi:nucleotide-diphospho-sugar transferase [Schizothecium vesticola]|uniref:Mannose-1-phosphate guanyltransferase n=1 Tax=Schizothecium vesticola TaxID=314040 RepID=A0AA40EJR2_9PEZI|nr:nucleotide-diphospho-sugar transferase [Schizothecium vesticola]
MPQAVTIASPGLQALILCGPGSSFPTFTANPDEKPKALIPLGNRPMVWYPLDFCYRAGITDITLVCPPSAAAAIDTALKTNPFLTSLPFPRPDLLAPKHLDLNTGTAQILALPELQTLVKSDFLVLPCDLVCELEADKLLQAWMVMAVSLPDLLNDTHTSHSLRSGGLGVWYDTRTLPIKGEETDFLGTVPLHSTTAHPPKGSLFPHLSKVVYSTPTDSLNDLLDKKNGFPVRRSLVRNHPAVRMRTTLRDAHLYIFPRWVMKFAHDNDQFEAIGEDIVGWWAKAGWQDGLAQKLRLDKLVELDNPKERKHEDKSRPSTATSSPTKGVATPSQQPGASPFSAKGTSAPHNAEPTRPRVPPMIAYVPPPPPAADAANSPPIIRRVDTAQLLAHTNQELAKHRSGDAARLDGLAPSIYAHTRKVAYPEGVHARAHVSEADSLLADNVTVQQRASIKASVVGANCQILEGAKLAQCTLFEGVVIGKNCKLTRCILGDNSEIGDGCVLTDCEVQHNMLVEPKTEAKGERFMSSSGLEATEEDMAAFDNDSDDGSGNGGKEGDDE